MVWTDWFGSTVQFDLKIEVVGKKHSGKLKGTSIVLRRSAERAQSATLILRHLAELLLGIAKLASPVTGVAEVHFAEQMTITA